MTRRETRKMVARRFGTHPLFGYRYCEGSRSVADFIESIYCYEQAGNTDEADYWRNELYTLVPLFRERV